MTRPPVSMERIYPKEMDASDPFEERSLKLHRERYAFAASRLLPGSVLDMACGSGYGTELLRTTKVSTITGVDIDADAIAYANAHYANDYVQFQQADVMTYQPSVLFDNIVSLETIEHLHDPGTYVSHLSQLLSPAGRLIISAPVTPSVDANPYHLHDFSPKTFRRLFNERGFSEIESYSQVQPFSLFQLRKKSSARTSDLRPSLLKWYLSHPGSFLRRLQSLATNGFNNRYLTLVLARK